MPKAIINDRHYEVQIRDREVRVNDQLLNWNIAALNDHTFHIIYQHRSYLAEVLSVDRSAKTVVMKINNAIYRAEVRDQLDELLEKMGMQQGGKGKEAVVRAPMPGLILDVKVQQGDQVQAGDALLILEAMKMENVLKASAPGTVNSLLVQKGQSVEKGQVLLELQ
jgi:biotin carboxyl carrier protein